MGQRKLLDKILSLIFIPLVQSIHGGAEHVLVQSVSVDGIVGVKEYIGLRYEE